MKVDELQLENVRHEMADSTLVVTIDRPKQLNALNAQTIREIGEVFDAARDDDRVRVVILTGGGEKAFVAGADINELATLDVVAGKGVAQKGQRMLDAIESFPKPVIAAINGFALGGGCELAMACHIRLASANAKLGLPETGLGIIPGYGGTQRLPRLVGLGKALELIATGKPVDAEEAKRIGLVNDVVTKEELLDRAREMAAAISANAPLAIRGAFEAAIHGLEMPKRQGLELEATVFGLLCATEDMKEGMNAFIEKRAKAFKGR